jgi:hypothetical protein
MKATLVVAAAVVALAVAAAPPPAGAGTRLPPAAPAGQMVFYGHIKSLTPSDGRYLLRSTRPGCSRARPRRRLPSATASSRRASPCRTTTIPPTRVTSC